MTSKKPVQIIIAEDDVGMAEIVYRKLNSAGFKVRHAGTGTDALKMCLEEPPDLMLLDLMMPEMDGFTVLQKIRENSNKKIANTPVMVLSNLWSNEDILKIQALKVEDYLVKAYFTPDEILAKINTVLSKK